MQYIIMLIIVIGLALSDFITGFIKAYIKNEVNSSKMRKGGINKIGEIVVMATVCGLEIGVRALGRYYNAENLAKIAGAVAAVGVFGYIALMELVSILENYAETNKDAVWVRKLLKRLKNVSEEEE